MIIIIIILIIITIIKIIIIKIIEIQETKGLQHLQPRFIISMYKHFIFYVIYLLSMYIRKTTGANCSVYATC